MEPKPDWATGCTCPLDYRGLGILYGVSFGKGWVRLRDDPSCPVHGHDEALRWSADRENQVAARDSAVKLD